MNNQINHPFGALPPLNAGVPQSPPASPQTPAGQGIVPNPAINWAPQAHAQAAFQTPLAHANAAPVNGMPLFLWADPDAQQNQFIGPFHDPAVHLLMPYANEIAAFFNADAPAAPQVNPLVPDPLAPFLQGLAPINMHLPAANPVAAQAAAHQNQAPELNTPATPRALLQQRNLMADFDAAAVEAAMLFPLTPDAASEHSSATAIAFTPQANVNQTQAQPDGTPTSAWQGGDAAGPSRWW